ncbi:MAG TPA: hypothetical protein VEV81_08745 [Pyrinomonadaceae bacterium]|nr:hypothetical protein [Pyrinomonadaceae bacterium]
MELLLNLLWVSVSLLVVFMWARAVWLGQTRLTWSAVAAVALLLLLILPVISMTDDLVAMAAPLEDDHPVRRGDMPLLHLDRLSSAPLDAIALVTLLLLGIAFIATRLTRLVPPSYCRTLLAGFARASFVRPPPSAALAA